MKQRLFILFWLIPFLLPAQKQVYTWNAVRFTGAEALSVELERWEIYTLDAALLSTAAQGSPEGLDMEWVLDGRSVSFRLFPEDIRSKNYRLLESGPEGLRELPQGPNVTYGGRVEGGGAIRLTVDRDFVFGYWEQDGKTWFVQPLSHFVPGAAPDRFVVFETDAVKPVPNAHCGWTHTQEMKHKVETDHGQAKMVGQCYETEIALASDFLMFQLLGSVTATQNFTLGVLNNVQTNFDDDFADEIRYIAVVNFVSSCASCDPWTASTVSNNLLVSFRDWGNSDGFGVPFDVASLWTNRDFNGDVIGLAWLGTLCLSNRYNILQRFTSNAPLLRVLQAHELGHNFGANHDATGSSTIMAPSVNSTNSWSGTSVSVINNFVNSTAASGNCFSSCGTSGPLPPLAQMQLPVTHVCPGSVVPLIDASLNGPTSWAWSLFGAIPGSSNQQHPVVVYNTPGIYPVQLTVSNSAGSDTQFSSTDIVVDNDGHKFLLYETFENDLVFWEVINPDNGSTWDVKEVGGSPYGKKAAFVNNFSYSGSGQVDGLVSPSFSLQGVTGPVLKIDYAYRRRNSSGSEQLRIKLSTNGGATYPHTLFTGQENGSGNFATGGLITGTFTPASANDWCYTDNPGTATCIELSLVAYAGNDNVRILIENVNAGNNNLYVDNVRVEVDCVPAVPPVAAIGAQPVTGCAPLTVFFQDNSIGAVDYRLWNFSGGSPATSESAFPVVTYALPGLYSVALEVFNGAGSSLLVENSLVDVITVPVADFSFVVNGNTVQFSNLSSGQGSYTWTFGDGQSSINPNPTHTYAQPGQYTIRLTTSNECGETIKERVVNLSVPPAAAFFATPLTGCTPLTVQFNNTSTGNPTAFAWVFPGGNPASSTASSPSVTYSTPGSYEVRLIATSGNLSDTLILPNYITVSALPEASFTLSYTPGATNATLTNTSTGADSIRWFAAGETSTDQTPVFHFPGDGVYVVQLIAYHTCGSDTTEQTITIVTLPQAGFEINAGAGCVPAEVQFNSASSANTHTHQWTFAGGTPSSSSVLNPIVTYDQPGTYIAVLIAGNAAGSDTLSQTVVIGEGPQAAFGISVNGNAVQFNASSTGATTYSWNFGDGAGSDSENPLHTYSGDGAYIVTLTVSNACGVSTTTDTVTISNALPAVNFSAVVREGCAPFEVQFVNESSANAQSFLWLFSGGIPETSTAPDPVVVYNQSGAYSATLTATNTVGSASIARMQYITVLSLPQAEFSHQILPGGEVSFTALSAQLPGLSYRWDFGDGSSSEQANPVHTFSANGVFSVSLEVTNACGTRTFTQEISVFINAIEEPEWGGRFVLHPNPASVWVRLSAEDLPVYSATERWTIVFRDALGRVVLRIPLQVVQGQLRQEISVADLPAGVYFYELARAPGVPSAVLRGKLVLTR